MVLQQIQAAYWRNEDRLLLRVSFKHEDGSLHEIRSWVTRRMVKALWPGIIQALETQVGLDNPNAAHASSEIVGMEHQAKVDEIRSRGDFDVPYSSEVDAYPFGKIPILLVQANISIGSKRGPRINFVSERNGSFELSFTASMLHGFCTVLQDAVKAADWDIELQMPSGASPLEWEGERVLN
ncbi:MAG TPA: hypothetical protein VF472_25630 [Burkholderiaceae bacterium]